MIDFSLNNYLNELAAVVNIDSGKLYADGTNAVADYFEKRYRSMGLNVVRQYNSNDIKKTSPFLTINNNNNKSIDLLIIGHMDTVFPIGTAKERPFTVELGDKAYGPGCSDCKGGLIMTVFLIENLIKKGLLNFNLCVAMNSDEECGSHFSESFLRELASKTKYCLVVEPGRLNGEYVIQRKGSVTYKINCYGISAHSGVNPQNGASAILELARWTLELNQLNDYEKGLTVNIGMFNGGESSNVIPDQATITVNFRIPDMNSLEIIQDKIRELSNHPFDSRCKVTVEQLGVRPPMVPTEKTYDLLRLLENAGEKVGCHIQAISTGGGSDGAFFADSGVPTIDGCGPCGAALHTDKEFLEISSVESRIDTLTSLIVSLFQQ